MQKTTPGVTLGLSVSELETCFWKLTGSHADRVQP